MFHKLKTLQQYKKVKKLYLKYERLLMPATLVFGFVVDAVTFRSIDINASFLLMSIHILLAGSAIAYMAIYDAGRIKGLGWRLVYVRYIRLAAPFILQISFGALLSGAFIFYYFGSSLAISWPFLIVIILLAVSNEIFRAYYTRPIVQIGMYYFSVFTVLAVILPYILKTIAGWPFFLAGVISWLLVFGFMRVLGRLSSEFAGQRTGIVAVLSGIFVVLSFFYVQNIIPPIPLSVSSEGVFHSVVRQGDEYGLIQEKQSVWDRLMSGLVIHIYNGDPVYIFTAVRAPAGLDERIVHRWQQYDSIADTWISRDRLSFAIIGGRVGGYRGYSYKTALAPGKWRVDVETDTGRVFGRVEFVVEVLELGQRVEKEIIMQ